MAVERCTREFGHAGRCDTPAMEHRLPASADPHRSLKEREVAALESIAESLAKMVPQSQPPPPFDTNTLQCSTSGCILGSYGHTSCIDINGLRLSRLP